MSSRVMMKSYGFEIYESLEADSKEQALEKIRKRLLEIANLPPEEFADSIAVWDY